MRPRSILAWLLAPSLVAAALVRPVAADRVILKSGRELVGTLLSDADHRVRFVDATRGELELPRHLVRTVVRGDAPPDLFAPLWLDAPVAPPERWVTVELPRDGKPGALSTGIGRLFDPDTRTTLFLVGAVHIGDPGYYSRLQDLLDSCDVVLFEGVGPQPGKPPPSPEEIARFDALFALQLKLNELLGLTFQRDGLDYRRPHWKNADVDLGSLHAELDARGAALPTDNPLVRGLLQLVLGSLDSSQLSRDPRLRAMVKRQAAATLATADKLLEGGAMKALDEVLIRWRNDAALAVVDRELADGAPGRWVALFYGAGHFPDLVTKLAARGFEFQGATFLEAWRIE